MKKLLLLINAAVISSFLFAQNEVLVTDLAGKYSGDTKKGLAHGIGEAQGKDNYKGEFKKGLPHGKGDYTWQTGEVFQGTWKKGIKEGFGKYIFHVEGGDSIIEGYWLKDQFVGDKPKPEPEYKILERDNIERVVFLKNSDEGNQIQIRITTKRGSAKDFIAYGTSGVLKDHDYMKIYEFVEFPFESTIKYVVPHVFTDMDVFVKLSYKINSPGSWIIEISH